MKEYIIGSNTTPRVVNKIGEYVGIRGVRVVNAKNNPYDGKQGFELSYEKDEALGLSSLGTPIYTDLVLLGAKYTDSLTQRVVDLPNDRYRTGDANTPANGLGNGIGAGFYMNLETVLITVTQPIRVIRTEIQGRNNTVKEYIGKDDATITINGIITGKNGVYPRDEVNRLVRWLDAPISKSVVAWWLGNLGIDNLVVTNYTIPQTQGGYSYQMFTIDCVSDAPVELKTIQPLQ